MVYTNDLSLNGDFGIITHFEIQFEPLLRLMARRSDLRRRILCSRTLSMRPATVSMNLAECVRATKDQLFIRQVLGWLSTAGPFWDDDRAANPDDLFYFEDEDVTNQGLAKRRADWLLELNAGTFSFSSPDSGTFREDAAVCQAQVAGTAARFI